MTTVNNSPDKNSMTQTLQAPPVCTEDDIYYFREGTNNRLYRWMGAHPCTHATQEGGKPEKGCWFAVWAPNAREVQVIGDFNGWQHGASPLSVRGDSSGIWEGFVPRATVGDCYKYRILSGATGEWLEKGDPFGFSWEEPPRTATRIADISYRWDDAEWMKTRGQANALNAPISIYECHLGSWMRPDDNPHGFLNYRDIAPKLADHVQSLGFTHVELMPITEHPFYGSWGYQTVGYFAPTSRYGSPTDFKAFVDYMHGRGIGVILDWVPSHFPGDAHGLHRFDGPELYEHADRRQGFHPEWNSWIFNYGRHEVRSFLLSSAAFWLDQYHIDGIRVDAVASMLYLDYSRESGGWQPNVFGGRENLEAISFLQESTATAYRVAPGIMMLAEESTSWPGVTAMTEHGGLGFGLKWNMGWMNDTLRYFEEKPVNRKWHHSEITFSLVYAFSEHFLLPLSHDEVVHGKGSLYAKMPGDDWQKLAGVRELLAYQWSHPGKKLLFMGQEFAQTEEWNESAGLQWWLTNEPSHDGVLSLVRRLNEVYREHPALWSDDFTNHGFEWIDGSDGDHNVISYLRRSADEEDILVVVCNFAGIPHGNYRVGLPFGGQWDEIVNTDALEYGGSGVGNFGAVEADEVGWNGRPYSASLELPPFGTVYLAPRDKEALKLAKIAAEEKRRAAEAEEAARAAEEAEEEELEAEDSEEAECGED